MRMWQSYLVITQKWWERWRKGSVGADKNSATTFRSCSFGGITTSPLKMQGGGVHKHCYLFIILHVLCSKNLYSHSCENPKFYTHFLFCVYEMDRALLPFHVYSLIA